MQNDKRTAVDEETRAMVELADDELSRVAGGLRLDGIRGESTDSKHKNEIDVLS